MGVINGTGISIPVDIQYESLEKFSTALRDAVSGVRELNTNAQNAEQTFRNFSKDAAQIPQYISYATKEAQTLSSELTSMDADLTSTQAKIADLRSQGKTETANKMENDAIARLTSQFNRVANTVNTFSAYATENGTNNAYFKSLEENYKKAIDAITNEASRNSSASMAMFNKVVSELKTVTSNSKVGGSSAGGIFYESGAVGDLAGTRSSSLGNTKFGDTVMRQIGSGKIDLSSAYGRVANVLQQMHLPEQIQRSVLDGAIAAAVNPLKTFDFAAIASRANGFRGGDLWLARNFDKLAGNISNKRMADLLGGSLFSDLYSSKGSTAQFRNAFGSQRILSDAGARELSKIISSNSLLSNMFFKEQHTSRSGNMRSRASLTGEFTVDEFMSRFIDPLVKSWETYAGQGIKAPVRDIKSGNIYDYEEADIKDRNGKTLSHRLYQRSLTGKAGEALSGLLEISKFIQSSGNFKEDGFGATINLTRQHARQFDSVNAWERNRNTGHRTRIALNESSMGRFLGLFGDDKEYRDQDIVKFEKFGNIDVTSEEDAAKLNDLVKKYLDPKSDYMFAGVHGTGSNQSMRLVKRDTLMQAGRVMAAIQRRAAGKEIGNIKDTDALAAIFNGVDITNEKAVAKAASADGKSIPVYLSGLLDKVNKQWTPSVTDTYSPVFSAFLDEKGKINQKAIDDFIATGVENQKGHVYTMKMNLGDQELLNGQAISFGAANENYQMRGAQGLKGSVISYGAAKGDELRRLLKSNGFEFSKDGKSILIPGYENSKDGSINFEEFENAVNNGGVTFYDETTVKNGDALTGSYGDKLRQFQVLNALMPTGSVRDYNADKDAKGIGAQAMNTLRLSPKFMEEYAAKVEDRIEEMNTLEGMLKYVFGDETSFYHKGLTGQLGMTGIDFLTANGDAIWKQVDSATEALRENFARGQFINVDRNTSISEGRTARSNIFTNILKNGVNNFSGKFNSLSTEEQQKLTERFNALKIKYTPANLEDKKYNKQLDDLAEDMFGSANGDLVRYLFAVRDYTTNAENGIDKEGKLSIGDLADIASLKGVNTKGVYLPKGMVDSLNKDSAMSVFNRAPTGIGQVIARANMYNMYDLMAKYTGTKMANGIMDFTDEDLEYLSSADFDGDMVKAIVARSGLFTGDASKFLSSGNIKSKADLEDYLKKIVNDSYEGFKNGKGGSGDATAAAFILSALGSEDMINSLGVKGGYQDILTKYQESVKASTKNIDPSDVVKIAGKEGAADKEITEYILRAAKAVQGMGLSSDIGSRATMLDYMDEDNREAFIAAIESNHLYDLWTTYAKRPHGVKPTDAMLKNLALGDEFSKITNLKKGLFDVKAAKDENGNWIYVDGQGNEVEDVLDVAVGNGSNAKISLIGLKRTKATDGSLAIDRLNFASRFTSANVFSSLVASLAGKGSQTMEDQIISRALTSDTSDHGIGYGEFDKLLENENLKNVEGIGEKIAAVKRLVNNSRLLKANFGGAVTMMSDETMEVLGLQMAAAEDALQSIVNGVAGPTGKVDATFLTGSKSRQMTSAQLAKELGRRLGFDQTKAMINAREMGAKGSRLTGSRYFGLDFTETGLAMQLMEEGYDKEDALALVARMKASDSSLNILDTNGVAELKEKYGNSEYYANIVNAQKQLRSELADPEKLANKIKARYKDLSVDQVLAKVEEIQAFALSSLNKGSAIDGLEFSASEIGNINMASAEDAQKAIESLTAKRIQETRKQMADNLAKASKSSSWSGLSKYIALAVEKEAGGDVTKMNLKDVLGIDTIDVLKGDSKETISGAISAIDPAYFEHGGNALSNLGINLGKILNGENANADPLITALGEVRHATYESLFGAANEKNLSQDEFRQQYIDQLKSKFKGFNFENNKFVKADGDDPDKIGEKLTNAVAKDVGYMYSLYKTYMGEGVEWIVSENKTKGKEDINKFVKDASGNFSYSIDGMYKRGNELHMVDYKSGKGGTMDALWQMIDYFGNLKSSDKLPEILGKDGKLDPNLELYADAWNMANGETMQIKVSNEAIEKMRKLRGKAQEFRAAMAKGDPNDPLFNDILALVNQSAIGNTSIKRAFDEGMQNASANGGGMSILANLPNATVGMIEQAKQIERYTANANKAYSSLMIPVYSELREEKKTQLEKEVDNILKGNTSDTAKEFMGRLGAAEYDYNQAVNNLKGFEGSQFAQDELNRLKDNRQKVWDSGDKILQGNISHKIDTLGQTADNVIGGEDLAGKIIETRRQLIEQQQSLKNDIENVDGSLEAWREAYRAHNGGTEAPENITASEIKTSLGEKLKEIEGKLGDATAYLLDQALSTLDGTVSELSNSIRGKNTGSSFELQVKAQEAAARNKIARAKKTIADLKESGADVSNEEAEIAALEEDLNNGGVRRTLKEQNAKKYRTYLSQLAVSEDMRKGNNPYSPEAMELELQKAKDTAEQMRNQALRDGLTPEEIKKLDNAAAREQEAIIRKYEHLNPAEQNFRTATEEYEDDTMKRLRRRKQTIKSRNEDSVTDLEYKQEQELYKFAKENAELEEEEYNKRRDKIIKRQELERKRLESTNKANEKIDSYQTELSDINNAYQNQELKDNLENIKAEDRIHRKSQIVKDRNAVQRKILDAKFKSQQMTEEDYNRQVNTLEASNEAADLREQIEKRDFEFRNKYIKSNAEIQNRQMQDRFNTTDMQRRARYMGSAVYSEYVSRLSEYQNEYNSTDSQLNNLKQQQEQYQMQGNKDAADALNAQIKTLEDRKSQLQQMLEGAQGIPGLINASATHFAKTINSAIQRFTTQLLRKGFAEAKKYIIEMDSMYANIAAIKTTNAGSPSDYQMDRIRSYTSATASELHTSAKNVATVEASLYRQGLSDAEVQERTKDVIKYATVTGTNVDKATKQLTTAVKSGLVKSLEEAMDAMVALGDAAATTAGEIAAGMQKSAATAKVAGVSFSELTALLTMGTANTQLGGAQIGTMLNTTFSRIRKITAEDLASIGDDGYGSINDTEKALNAVGLTIFKDDVAGEFKSAVEIFRDIASVWQNLNDVEKSAITYAVAGTRQTNVFSTFMEGMSEDDGATFDQYVRTAEESAGITAKKYSVITETIQTKLQDITNAFDNLIASLDTDAIRNALDVVAKFIDKLSGLGGVGGLTAAAGTTLLAGSALKGAVGAITSVPMAGLLIGGGLLAGAGIYEAISEIKKTGNPEYQYEKQTNTNNEIMQRSASVASKLIEATSSNVTTVLGIKSKYGSVQEALNANNKDAGILDSIIESTKNRFPELANAIDAATSDAADSFDDLITVLNKATTSSEALAKAQAKNLIFNTQDPLKSNISDNSPILQIIEGLSSGYFKDSNLSKDELANLLLGNFGTGAHDGAVGMLYQLSTNDNLKGIYEDISKVFVDEKYGMSLEEYANDYFRMYGTELDSDNDLREAFVKAFNEALKNYSLLGGNSYINLDSVVENIMGSMSGVFEGLDLFNMDTESARKSLLNYLNTQDVSSLIGASYREVLDAWLKSLGVTIRSTADEIAAALNTESDSVAKYTFDTGNGIFAFNSTNAADIGQEFTNWQIEQLKDKRSAKIVSAKDKVDDITRKLHEANKDLDEARKEASDNPQIEAIKKYHDAQMIVNGLIEDLAKANAELDYYESTYTEDIDKQIIALQEESLDTNKLEEKGYEIIAGATDAKGNSITPSFKNQVNGAVTPTAEKNVKLQFAAMLGMFDSYDKFAEYMDSKPAFKDKFKAIYTSTEFADAAAAVEKGAKDYGDLIDVVLGSADSIRTYADNLSILSTTQQNDSKLNLYNTIASGNYNETELQSFASDMGLDLTGYSDDSIKALAASAASNMQETILAFGRDQLAYINDTLKGFNVEANSYEEAFDKVGEPAEETKQAYENLIAAGYTFSYGSGAVQYNGQQLNPWESALATAGINDENLSELGGESIISYLESGEAAATDFMDKLGSNKAWQTIITSNEKAAKIMRDFKNGIIDAKTAAEQLGSALNKSAREDSKFNKSFGSTLESMSKLRYYIDNANDKESQDALAKESGFSDYESAVANGFDLDKLRSNAETSISSMVLDLQDDLNARTNVLEGYSMESLKIALPDIDLENGQIIDNVDMITPLQGIIDDETYKALSAFIGAGGTLVANVTGDDTTAGITWSLGSYSTGARGYRGGGGGGGKSATDKLIEKWNRIFGVRSHRLNMLHSEQEYYQQRGELANYGAFLAAEPEEQRMYIDELEQANDELKSQMKKVEKGSDDWYKLTEQIQKNEEAQQGARNAIDATTKKIEENNSAIRQTRIELEKSINEEYINRENRRRDMLAGQVEMQNLILDAIKQRYQDEWDLVKKDLETKKNALEEEKNLINERLQARKNAADDATKYEELENLKSQLSMIQMDSTRTKDAIELRKKISDLESELSWKSAQEQADYMTEGLDQQIKAYDDYTQAGDENLEKLLSDDNNFADEVQSILGGSQEEIMQWMSNNIKEYADATEAAQLQMIDSWTDTYKKMLGITDTYWDEAANIIKRKGYVDFMKQSQEYLTASDTQKVELEYQYNKQAETFYNTGLTNGEEDIWLLNYDEMLANIVNSQNATEAYAEYVKTLADQSWSHDDDWRSYGTSGSDSPAAKTTAENTTLIKESVDVIAKNGVAIRLEDENHVPIGLGGVNAYLKAEDTYTNARAIKDIIKAQGIKAYAEGGINTHSGLAWLDGTSANPEYVLNSYDFATLRDIVSTAKSFYVPNITTIDTSKFANSGSNIGTVSITINEAQISSDYDIGILAERVGEKFVESIGNSGINVNKYSW